MNFTCERRKESNLHLDNSPLKMSGSNKDTWEEDHTCSFCGSLSSDEFFKAVEAGTTITPTDKSYKLYVEVPNPHADKLGCFSSSTSPFGSAFLLTEEKAKEITWGRGQRAEDYIGRWVETSPHPKTLTLKFYYQHFSIPEQEKFIDLVNSKKINFAFPGHLYVRPYFCRFRTKEEIQ